MRCFKRWCFSGWGELPGSGYNQRPVEDLLLVLWQPSDAPWARQVDFVFQHLEYNTWKEDAVHWDAESPSKRCYVFWGRVIVWILSSGTAKRATRYVTSFSCYSCALQSFCNTQRFWGCVFLKRRKKENLWNPKLFPLSLTQLPQWTVRS